MNKKKIKYYSLNSILKMNCIYNIIIGERSNGKSYAMKELALKEYLTSGKQTAYVRRHVETMADMNPHLLFDDIIQNGILENTNWNSIVFKKGAWYLAECFDGEILNLSPTPFMFLFALTKQENDKSLSFPDINIIWFEEFTTRRYYLNNEFVLFMNLISTIVRDRDDVKIFMTGNTVDKYCPYFEDMGLYQIQNMKKGTIDLYKYGESGLNIAVEYCANLNTSKPSDKYFAFDNPHLKMITNGDWEISIYPHLPIGYEVKKIIISFFIEFKTNILQCDIVNDKYPFIYVHRKTTKIKNDDDLVYTLIPDPSPYRKRDILNGNDKISNIISTLIKNEKIFFQDNNIGEIFYNYLKYSKKSPLD